VAESPSRYCGNCGNELSSEDQFCRSCGTPVHQAARVPTPEADVPVPPPTQSQGGAATSPEQPAQANFGRRHPILTGCLAIIGILLILVVLPVALGGGGGETAGGGGGDAASSDAPNAQEEQYSSEIDTFTRENYRILVANPDEHVGAKVDITGQLLDNPENQGDEVAFQMWADPVKVDLNTIVRTDQQALGLGSDAYVHVRGTVLGSFEGENAFGGTVSAVEVEADEVERVEAVDTIDPTQKTVEVGQTQSSEGFGITLQKL
jgi:hypothetical protein